MPRKPGHTLTIHFAPITLKVPDLQVESFLGEYGETTLEGFAKSFIASLAHDGNFATELIASFGGMRAEVDVDGTTVRGRGKPLARA